MHLVLVRHTKPVMGSDICYGNLDIGLAATFEADCAAVQAVVPSVDRIFSSPLQRCRVLAERIANVAGKGFVCDPALQEMNFGSWQGCKWDDVSISQLDEWAADFEDARPHGGESISQLRLRLKELVVSLDACSEERILMVTHAGVIRVLIAMCTQCDERDIQVDYGEVIELFLPTSKGLLNGIG